VLGGLCACIGILSSIIAIRNGKPGQKVDIALVDSVVSAMETIIQIYLVEEREPKRTGNRYEFILKKGHRFHRQLERSAIARYRFFQKSNDWTHGDSRISRDLWKFDGVGQVIANKALSKIKEVKRT
jgi:crotonobetainyl-CoA:carnitine CoA-transferase CaiB-like acyl-CoA transferase